MDRTIQSAIKWLMITSLIAMLGLYINGYSNSISWEVTSTAEVIEVPGIIIQGQLLDYEITGEKYLLTEAYSGGRIQRNYQVEQVFIALQWIGIGLALTLASFLSRTGFMISLALFALFVNRLSLSDVGLFGIQESWLLIIPFVTVAGPLFYFHEYKPSTPFWVRFGIVLILPIFIIVFGADNKEVFFDHYASHSLFTAAIASLLFLFAIAEENIFALLFMVTRGKGGAKNHLHFILLGLIYLVNLVLYYLNKSGFVPNSFSFFNPWILLTITTLVATWSLAFKENFLGKYFQNKTFSSLIFSLGIVLFSTLSIAFYRGVDGISESFHYFILYFHIGFGAFFFILYHNEFYRPSGSRVRSI